MKLLLALLLICATGYGQTITVDPATSFQTMRGWEAHAQSGEIDFPSNFAIYGPTLLDQAVEMGLNRVRLEIHAGWENTSGSENTAAINDNADPNVYNAAGFRWGNFDIRMNSVVVPLRNRLLAQGEALYINLCYVDFLDNGGSFYHCNTASEYAEFVLAAFDRMNSTWGFVPDALEVILEPDSGNNLTRWTATKVAACLIAAQSRLAAGGYNPRFIIPGTTSCPNADTWYSDIKTADSNVVQYVDELAYHRYSNCDATQLQANRDAAQADGNRISMLEWWDNSNDYTTLHADIGPNGNAVSWEPEVIAYPGQAGPLFQVDGSNNITMNSRAKLYRQYWKWVRFGAVRKATSTDNGNIDGLAFRNTNGNYAVVVKALASGNISITGIPAGTYHIRYTTASAYDQNPGDQTIGAGGTISTSIPAAGVLTAYADAPSGTRSAVTGKVTSLGRVVIK